MKKFFEWFKANEEKSLIFTSLFKKGDKEIKDYKRNIEKGIEESKSLLLKLRKDDNGKHLPQ